MKDTTLVKIPAQELEELATFVQSPFFNDGSHFNTLNRLYKLLKEKLLDEAMEDALLWYWLEDSLLELKTLRNNRKGNVNLPATIEKLTLFYATKLLNLTMMQSQQKRVLFQSIKAAGNEKTYRTLHPTNG